MQRNNSNNQAVSEVVGEMLMIGIVLILAAVFTSQLPNYLPSERSPSVTIMMSNEPTGNVTFWHKGGDWVKVNTIRVVISNPSGSSNQNGNYASTDPSALSSPRILKKPTIPRPLIWWKYHGCFRLTFYSNTTVTLATDRAVLFSGVISGGQP